MVLRKGVHVACEDGLELIEACILQHLRAGGCESGLLGDLFLVAGPVSFASLWAVVFAPQSL